MRLSLSYPVGPAAAVVMGCALLLQHGGGTSGSHGNGRRWPVMISDAGETGIRGACSLLARPTAEYYNDVDNNKNNNVVNVRCD